MVFLATGWARLTYVTHIIETLYCTAVMIHVSVSFLFVYLAIFCPCLSLFPTGPSPVYVSVNDLHARFFTTATRNLTRTRVLQRESFQLLADWRKS